MSPCNRIQRGVQAAQGLNSFVFAKAHNSLWRCVPLSQPLQHNTTFLTRSGGMYLPYMTYPLHPLDLTPAPRVSEHPGHGHAARRIGRSHLTCASSEKQPLRPVTLACAKISVPPAVQSPQKQEVKRRPYHRQRVFRAGRDIWKHHLRFCARKPCLSSS